jgi:hypothetical protein
MDKETRIRIESERDKLIAVVTNLTNSRHDQLVKLGLESWVDALNWVLSLEE